MDKDNEEIVGWCSSVTRGEIITAIEGGASSLDDIRSATGACTVGRCRELSPKKRCCAPDIAKILKEFGKA